MERGIGSEDFRGEPHVRDLEPYRRLVARARRLRSVVTRGSTPRTIAGRAMSELRLARVDW